MRWAEEMKAIGMEIEEREAMDMERSAMLRKEEGKKKKEILLNMLQGYANWKKIFWKTCLKNMLGHI